MRTVEFAFDFALKTIRAAPFWRSPVAPSGCISRSGSFLSPFDSIPYHGADWRGEGEGAKSCC